MNLEEEQLKRRVEERQLALTAKVTELKRRVEHIRRMTDVKSIAKDRPAVLLAGSVLVGFIVKKLVSGKIRRHANDAAYRSDSRSDFSSTSASTGGRLWEPIVAAMTAVATRTAMNLVNGIIHRRHETGRFRHNSHKF
jgi:hypothetical protein